MKEYILTDYGVKADYDGYQTAEIQAVLDMCKENGGKVIVPAGTFKITSVRMWSDTELYLENGAKIIGSDNCDDYIIFELPEDFELFSDQQAFIYRNNGIVRDEYRRALISAYGEKNISVIGEEGSVIDGIDCYDPDGEENFRGPHGIFFSGCENVTLRGYTIQNTGNFMHQLDNCENVVMDKVTALAGHDGIHLHCCRHMKITDCTFRTGDDCIAGCNIFDLTVSGCYINTSCNPFRIGGIDILIENNEIEGPGYYPHLLSVVTGRERNFKRTDGRHNSICFIEYFSTRMFDCSKPSQNIVVRNCSVKNVDRLMNYKCNFEPYYHEGMPLKDITFENMEITGLVDTSVIIGDEDNIVRINFNNVKASFKEGMEKPLYEAQYAVVATDGNEVLYN